MLARVLDVWEQFCLVQDFCCLQASQGLRKLLIGKLPHCLQDAKGSRISDDGDGLKKALVERRQMVDTRGQQRFDRRRYFQVRNRCCRKICSRFSAQSTGFYERLHALLNKEWIALGLLDKKMLERFETLISADEHVEHVVSNNGRKRINPNLCVIGPTSPAVPVLGSVGNEEQEACGRQALDESIDHH